MLKHFNNNGFALLIVMSVIATTAIVISLLFFMLNSENNMNYKYICAGRAAQFAEAGADLVVNEWIKYINNKHDLSFEEWPDVVTNGIDISGDNEFIEVLELKKYSLQNSLENGLITCDYHVEDINDDNDGDTLIINITGSYNGEEYEYQVKLQYNKLGAVKTYKGEKLLVTGDIEDLGIICK